jgi:hypothetical protein
VPVYVESLGVTESTDFSKAYAVIFFLRVDVSTTAIVSVVGYLSKEFVVEILPGREESGGDTECSAFFLEPIYSVDGLSVA